MKRLMMSILLMSGVAIQAHAESWADKTSLSGDFVFREQYLQYDNPSQPANTSAINYNNQRSFWNNAARYRLMATSKINDMIKVYARVATNYSGRTSYIYSGDYTSDPNTQGTTANQTTPNKFQIGLDLAYAELGSTIDGMGLWLGKSLNPYWSASNNEMIFDQDLTFEGAAFKWTLDAGNWKPFLNLGASWLQKGIPTWTAGVNGGNGAPSDSVLFAAQLGTTGKLTDRFDMAIAVSNFNFTGLKGKPLLYGYQGGNFVTTTGGVSTYSDDFNLIDAGLELTYDLGMPLAVSFDYVTNSAVSDSTQNSGYTAGIKYGKLRDIGSWFVGLQYRYVKAEAVVAALADSDFAGVASGSNVRGMKVSAGWQWLENTALIANYWANQYNTDGTPNNNWSGTASNYSRVDLDLNLKF